MTLVLGPHTAVGPFLAETERGSIEWQLWATVPWSAITRAGLEGLTAHLESFDGIRLLPYEVRTTRPLDRDVLAYLVEMAQQ